MRAAFTQHGLPQFERIEGVEVKEAEVDQMTPPRVAKGLKVCVNIFTCVVVCMCVCCVFAVEVKEAEVDQMTPPRVAKGLKVRVNIFVCVAVCMCVCCVFAVR